MRMVLVNAGKTTISLEEELNMLKLYLNMEQLRFKDASITLFIATPSTAVYGKRALLRAATFLRKRHLDGLLHKEGKGQLNIHLKMKSGFNLHIKDKVSV